MLGERIFKSCIPLHGEMQSLEKFTWHTQMRLPKSLCCSVQLPLCLSPWSSLSLNLVCFPHSFHTYMLQPRPSEKQKSIWITKVHPGSSPGVCKIAFILQQLLLAVKKKHMPIRTQFSLPHLPKTPDKSSTMRDFFTAVP